MKQKINETFEAKLKREEKEKGKKKQIFGVWTNIEQLRKDAKYVDDDFFWNFSQWRKM